MHMEKEAIYIGGHKIAYRAMRGGKRGILYKKNNEEIFQPCSEFFENVLIGPYITIKEYEERERNT